MKGSRSCGKASTLGKAWRAGAFRDSMKGGRVAWGARETGLWVWGWKSLARLRLGECRGSL